MTKQYIIDICQTIMTDDDKLFWFKNIPDRESYNLSDDLERKEYEDVWNEIHNGRYMLYEIVKKAYNDNFDIQNYYISDRPLQNLFYFHNKNNNKCICFFVVLDKENSKRVAVPQYFDGMHLSRRNVCQDAVWCDNK